MKTKSKIIMSLLTSMLISTNLFAVSTVSDSLADALGILPRMPLNTSSTTTNPDGSTTTTTTTYTCSGTVFNTRNSTLCDGVVTSETTSTTTTPPPSTDPVIVDPVVVSDPVIVPVIVDPITEPVVEFVPVEILEQPAKFGEVGKKDPISLKDFSVKQITFDNNLNEDKTKVNSVNGKYIPISYTPPSFTAPQVQQQHYKY